MTYRETVKIPKEIFERMNKLLNIDDLNNLTKEEKLLNPKQDDFIGLIFMDFENGNSITVDVCSGSHNYYDNCVLKDGNGYELTCFDCSYELYNEIVS